MKMSTLEKFCFVCRVLMVISWHVLLLMILLKYVC